MKGVNIKMLVSIAGTLAALSAGFGAAYALYAFNIKRQKQAIARKLSLQVKNYLRKKAFIKKGEVIKIIETDNKVGGYFMNLSLEELRELEKLPTVELLNKKF